jgi:DNA-binding response OmpR family regulator
MPSQPERVAVVIEDDADIRNLLEAILGQAGFTCHSAADGVEGIAAVRDHEPILTTLDISLPGIDGFEVARRIRAFSMTYIVMLSARDEEIDTLMGLDAGADDYLTKPFRPRELRARIEAMLRRYHQTRPQGEAAIAESVVGGRSSDQSRAATTSPAPDPAAAGPNEDDSGWLSHNGLRINADMWLCDLHGAPLELTRSEFDLLLAIMQGQRRVLSKDSLALELRGEQGTGAYVSDSDRRAVEVHMANLRRKLNDTVSKPRYIETVRGVGYRLAEPD